MLPGTLAQARSSRQSVPRPRDACRGGSDGRLPDFGLETRAETFQNA